MTGDWCRRDGEGNEGQPNGGMKRSDRAQILIDEACKLPI